MYHLKEFNAVRRNPYSKMQCIIYLYYSHDPFPYTIAFIGLVMASKGNQMYALPYMLYATVLAVLFPILFTFQLKYVVDLIINESLTDPNYVLRQKKLVDMQLSYFGYLPNHLPPEDADSDEQIDLLEITALDQRVANADQTLYNHLTIEAMLVLFAGNCASTLAFLSCKSTCR